MTLSYKEMFKTQNTYNCKLPFDRINEYADHS
jgi:hypothetical protein